MSRLSFQGSRSGHFYPACGRGKAPPPCVRRRRKQGLPPPQPGKWHRPSAVTQKRHQQRVKGEAAKQRASEQPVLTNLSLEMVCMKIWCSLNRDSANRWRESCALWSSLPVVYVIKRFWENSYYPNPPSNLVIRIDISGLWSLPDHQQGIRCKAPRRDD